MLSRPFAGKADLVKKLNYGKDEFLTPDLIRAYVAENNGLTSCQVDDFGIDMPVSDKTIDDINRASNELASRLSEDSGEWKLLLAENLRTILTPKVLVAPDSNNRTFLEEKNEMEVEVIQVPKEAVTTDLRKIGSLSGVGDGQWKQICDYLMVCSNGDKSIAIFIELKKTLKNDNKPQEQLRRSLPLLNYLHSICRIEFNTTKSKALIVRYFLIGERLSSRFDKQRIKPDLKVQKEHYKNIEIYWFLGKRISFDKLITWKSVSLISDMTIYTPRVLLTPFYLSFK